MIEDMGKGVERGRTHGRGLRRDGVAKPREKGTSSGFLSKNYERRYSTEILTNEIK